MTLKQKRAEQLDSLKNASNASVMFCVDILNGSFIPYKTITFDSLEEAQAEYDKLARIYYPAFVRKYAKVPF